MSLRIGFCLPSSFALDGSGNGVRAQALRQAAALERAGHRVERLDPWEPFQSGSLDVVQFFMGGFALHNVEAARPRAVKNLVFAPIIDSNEPNWRYRLASSLGALHPKVFTIPGVLRAQALGSVLVVCRSQHEERRVRDGLGVDPLRVPTAIVLNGVDAQVPADPDDVCGALGLPRPFLLHVSYYTQSRKNVERLVEAVAPTGLPLVIAGTAEPGPILDRLTRRAATCGNLRLLGFQEPRALRALYAAAKVFCLPSLHEGTGLAALEAASYGAEIVITRNGGPPDYFGEFAEYVDPEDVAGIRAAVLRAWAKPRSLALRDHVLRELTWDRSAQALLAAYRAHLDLPA